MIHLSQIYRGDMRGQGFLPTAGGILDQPAATWASIQIVEAAERTIRAAYRVKPREKGSA